MEIPSQLVGEARSKPIRQCLMIPEYDLISSKFWGAVAGAPGIKGAKTWADMQPTSSSLNHSESTPLRIISLLDGT